MSTVRLQLRFLVPLIVTLAVAAYLSLPIMDRLTLRWLARDLNLPGSLVTNALSDSIAQALDDRKGIRLQTIFKRAVQDERLVALGLCATDGVLLRRTAVALIAVVVAQLGWRGWVAGARALLRGEGIVRPIGVTRGELAPFMLDLRARLRELEDEYKRSLGPPPPAAPGSSLT